MGVADCAFAKRIDIPSTQNMAMKIDPALALRIIQAYWWHQNAFYNF
jgi:hypothetical protein